MEEIELLNKRPQSLKNRNYYLFTITFANGKEFTNALKNVLIQKPNIPYKREENENLKKELKK
jgi:hypothetical protein